MVPVPGDWQKNVEGRPGRPNRAALCPAASGGAGGAANGPSQGQGPAGQATLGAGGPAEAHGMACCQHTLGGPMLV